jgi:hypothetical protein
MNSTLGPPPIHYRGRQVPSDLIDSSTSQTTSPSPRTASPKIPIVLPVARALNAAPDELAAGAPDEVGDAEPVDDAEDDELDLELVSISGGVERYSLCQTCG